MTDDKEIDDAKATQLVKVSAAVDTARSEVRRLAVRGNAAGATAALAFFAAQVSGHGQYLLPVETLNIASCYLVGLLCGAISYVLEVRMSEFRFDLLLMRAESEEARATLAHNIRYYARYILDLVALWAAIGTTVAAIGYLYLIAVLISPT